MTYLQASRYRYTDGARAVSVRFRLYRLTGQFSFILGWKRAAS